MTITGAYIKDIDVTTLITENIMSKINHKTGEVSHTKVNDFLPDGRVLTSDLFQKWKSKCTKTCTFDVFDPNFQ